MCFTHAHLSIINSGIIFKMFTTGVGDECQTGRNHDINAHACIPDFADSNAKPLHGDNFMASDATYTAYTSHVPEIACKYNTGAYLLFLYGHTRCNLCRLLAYRWADMRLNDRLAKSIPNHVICINYESDDQQSDSSTDSWYLPIYTEILNNGRQFVRSDY